MTAGDLIWAVVGIILIIWAVGSWIFVRRSIARKKLGR